METEKKLFIITGGSNGLGFELVKELAGNDFNVISLARNKSSNIFNNNVTQIPLDLSDSNMVNHVGTDFLRNLTFEPYQLVFINNAATLGYIGNFKNGKITDIEYAVNVNLISPLKLVNNLLAKNRLNNIEFRFINISSDAANKYYSNWLLYCSTKTALLNAWCILANENTNESTKFLSIDPGYLDTRMQANLRAMDLNSLPNRDYFEGLSSKQKLKNPTEVAKAILVILEKDNFKTGEIIKL